MDTIFALSSGAPPAGIGVIRITGPDVRNALESLIGRVPSPRRATRVVFRDASGELLDDGLALFFPGPNSATGEDLGELHCHGGRAVVAAIETALSQVPGCRRAVQGEFTRRAFANGRIDLAEAEGLADLLSAETEIQRRSAVAMAGGALSRQVEHWRMELLHLSAQVEAALDFNDEDDVMELPPTFPAALGHLAESIRAALAAPHAEILREGYRIALAGPPNAGKSTLFNALVEREAAIIADVAGTTRDILTASVALAGVPITFVDMAGVRDATDDPIEEIGISRARDEMDRADLVLWLGPEGEGPEGAWEIEAQIDRVGSVFKPTAMHRVSAATNEGMAQLREALIARARTAMPVAGTVALTSRQRDLLHSANASIEAAGSLRDLLTIAEELRRARTSFDAITGRASTEDVLDTLFGRFCIGK